MNIISKLRRGMSLLLVAILVFGLAACGAKEEPAPAEAADVKEKAESEDEKKVGFFGRIFGRR